MTITSGYPLLVEGSLRDSSDWSQIEGDLKLKIGTDVGSPFWLGGVCGGSFGILGTNYSWGMVRLYFWPDGRR